MRFCEKDIDTTSHSEPHSVFVCSLCAATDSLSCLKALLGVNRAIIRVKLSVAPQQHLYTCIYTLHTHFTFYTQSSHSAADRVSSDACNTSLSRCVLLLCPDSAPLLGLTQMMLFNELYLIGIVIFQCDKMLLIHALHVASVMHTLDPFVVYPTSL